MNFTKVGIINKNELFLLKFLDEETDLFALREKCFFMSDETFSKTLFNLHSKFIIDIDLKNKIVYFSKKQKMVIDFIDETDFAKYCPKIRVRKVDDVHNVELFNILMSPTLSEYFEKEGRIKLNDILTLCMNYKFNDNFFIEVGRLRIR